MANSVDDLTLLMETTLARRPWDYDASSVNTPWRNLDDGVKTLTIGLLPEDPNYPLHPPVRRALNDAVLALEAAGHNVVHLPSDPSRSASVGGRLGFSYFGMTSSGLDALANTIGEPLVPSVKRNVHPFNDDKPPISPELDTAHQLSEFLRLRSGYADSWRSTWRDNNLDVVVGPGAISTAVPHDTYGAPVYTLMWNVLDVSKCHRLHAVIHSLINYSIQLELYLMALLRRTKTFSIKKQSPQLMQTVSSTLSWSSLPPPSPSWY